MNNMLNAVLQLLAKNDKTYLFSIRHRIFKLIIVIFYYIAIVFMSFMTIQSYITVAVYNIAL